MSKLKASLTKGSPIPENLGAVADMFAAVRAVRLLMDKEVAAVKARETELSEYMLNTLSRSEKEGQRGAVGMKYQVQLTEKEVFTPVDWPKIQAYVAKTKAFDILGKSINQKALTDRAAEGLTVPGVDTMIVKGLSITKVK